jgi:hypothetical protein
MEELQLQDLQNIEAIVARWHRSVGNYTEAEEAQTCGGCKTERKTGET